MVKTMSSVLCNQPTPNGLCQRPVSAPGAHCGVAHTEAVSPLGPTPAPPAPSAPVDPFGNAPGGFDVRRQGREIQEALDWAKARRERDARYAKTKGQNQSPSPASDPLQQTFGESVEKRVTDAAPELGSAMVASIATGSPVPVAGGAAGVVAGVAADQLGAGPRRRRRLLKARKRRIAQIIADASSPEPGVRAMVAKESKSERLLENLGGDRDPYVRRWVAWNENTPGYVLTRLASAPETEVREEVASNPATPPSTLAHLARDPDAGVRLCVARNSSTPTRVLEDRLARYEHLPFWSKAEVRQELTADIPDAASRQLGARSVGMHDIDPKIRLDLARNPETPRETLAYLAGRRDDPDEWVVDESVEVRQAVVQNPSTATEVIWDLAKNDPDSRIRAQALLRLG